MSRAARWSLTANEGPYPDARLLARLTDGEQSAASVAPINRTAQVRAESLRPLPARCGRVEGRSYRGVHDCPPLTVFEDHGLR